MTPPNAPAVLLWQRVYCIAMALVYVLVALLAVLMFAFPEEVADASNGEAEMRIFAVLLGVVSVALAAIYAAGPFLPRRRWAWVYHLVLIAIGMTSCPCIPFCVPLLVFWIRPDAQGWFAAG